MHDLHALRPSRMALVLLSNVPGLIVRMSKSPFQSPFTPKTFPRLPKIDGVRIATAEAGIRYRNREDLLLAVFDPGTTVAGTFTQSKTASAPVLWCKKRVKAGQARALVVNSGNANAFTGQRGVDTVKTTVEAAADAAGCAPRDVYVASTGVIGEPLDPGPFVDLLGDLASKAKSGQFQNAARAIMTTDTYPKVATAKVNIGKTPVTINAVAKGAGMIAPDMATMLCFVFTDAALPAGVMQEMLSAHVRTTFNCMTVDGDTSTSDTCLMFATGAAKTRGQPKISSPSSKALAEFSQALHDVLKNLAIQIAKDGEGLSKFVTIQVSGAKSWKAARKIGLACANSPILKTAFAGEDPNWGRVVMAVGKSGEAANRDKLTIWFGPHCVARDGERAPDYSEAKAAKYMQNDEIDLHIDVGVGESSATVWTCDLTHDYVSINADYRT